MSTTDQDGTPEDGGRIVAAEYVLGVLGAEERREIERRLEREPALAREVALWEERLTGLVNSVRPVAPPADTWTRIEAAVAASPAPARTGLWQSLEFWRTFGIGAAALAAASIAALTYVGLVPAPRAPMVATLGQTSGQPGFVAAVSTGGDSLVVVPAALLTSDQRAMELWLIPPGDRPHSLGLIHPGQPVRLNVPPALVGRITTDATLAVSLEPPGGSPTGQPTGPVVATGKLTSL